MKFISSCAMQCRQYKNVLKKIIKNVDSFGFKKDGFSKKLNKDFLT